MKSLDDMTPDECRAVAYRLGHHFASKELGAGKSPDSVRFSVEYAEEDLKAQGGYSADLDEMKRRGVEDALAGRPRDPRYAPPGSPP